MSLSFFNRFPIAQNRYNHNEENSNLLFNPSVFGEHGIGGDYVFYTFTSDSEINYTVSGGPKTIHLFIVGGGGTGGADQGGGGGGGGVLQTTIRLPVGSSSISVSVAPPSELNSIPFNNVINGYNTTVTFHWNSVVLTAYGGGGGAGYNQNGPNGSARQGGSGGGGSCVAYANSRTSLYGATQSSEASAANNIGNKGGDAFNQYASGGGGGAGTSGVNGTQITAGNGAIGIHCTIPDINHFHHYGTYFWAAGGGGGGRLSATAGNGGVGGGGGGCTHSSIGIGGISALNVGSQGVSGLGGDAGLNTGSGGGGSMQSPISGGRGGSGIVIISYSF